MSLDRSTLSIPASSYSKASSYSFFACSQLTNSVKGVIESAKMMEDASLVWVILHVIAEAELSSHSSKSLSSPSSEVPR